MVKLFKIKDEKRFFYSYIYGANSVLIDKTFRVLEEKEVIPENKFKDIIEMYYQEVKDSTSNDEALSILENVVRFEFDKMQNAFKLIAEDYPKIDVFIECDKEAAMIWREFQKIQDITDAAEKRQRFMKIKKQLRDYIISVPEKYKEEVGYMESIGMGYLSKMIIQQTGIYDKQLGFLKDQVTNTFFT